MSRCSQILSEEAYARLFGKSGQHETLRCIKAAQVDGRCWYHTTKAVREEAGMWGGPR